MAKTEKITSIIIYTFLLLAVIGVLGFIGIFTNWFTDDFKEFYIEYNDSVLPTRSSQRIIPDTDNRFNVRYTFNFMTSEESKLKGYSVKILSNPEQDFNFTAGEDIYGYSGITDFVPAFAVQLFEDYFTLNISSDDTLQSVVQRLYPEKEVIMEDKDIYKTDYFLLQVFSYNEKAVIQFTFRLSSDTVPAEVQLSQGGIVL